jgi:hypothetical protein
MCRSCVDRQIKAFSKEDKIDRFSNRPQLHGTRYIELYKAFIDYTEHKKLPNKDSKFHIAEVNEKIYVFDSGVFYRFEIEDNPTKLIIAVYCLYGPRCPTCRKLSYPQEFYMTNFIKQTK